MAQIDLETITNEDYFAALNEMFQSVGWAVMCAELEDNAELIQDLQSVENERDLYFKQGQLATIALLLNFESTLALSDTEEDLNEGS
jgi:hypothetical protein